MVSAIWITPRGGGLVTAVLLGSMSSAVWAHSRLVEPPSRSEEDFLMEGPCGAVAPTGERTVFEAGQTTVLRWELTQNHNAQFRVAFSPEGDEGFDDWVLGTRPDVRGEFSYEQELALPECVCDACSLQLLQYSSMTMLAAYYSCADIELTQPEGGQLPACALADAGGSTSGGDPDSGTEGGETTGDSGIDPAESTDTTVAATEGGSPGQQDAGGCRVGPARLPPGRGSCSSLRCDADRARGSPAGEASKHG